MSATPCPLCGRDLDAGDERVAANGGLAADHPLWRYSDAKMHRACFLVWEHRAAFVDAFNERAVARSPDSGRQRHMREDGVVLESRTRAMDERDFWTELEWRVTAELGRSGEGQERGLWCDGLVADTFEFDRVPARILGTAWIGLGNGDQEAWTFELLLPAAVASREELRWSELLSPDGCSDWLDVDQEHEHLVLRAVGSPGEA